MTSPRYDLRARESSHMAEEMLRRASAVQLRLLVASQQQQDGEGDGEEPLCRICQEGEERPDADPLLVACRCKGSVAFTHRSCLQKWLTMANRSRCELCGFRYRLETSRRYRRLESVRVWVRQHANHRQMVCDVVIFFTMTPAIVLGSVVGLRTARGFAGDADAAHFVDDLPPSYGTAIGIGVVAVISCVAYLFWVGSTIISYVKLWHRWWTHCLDVRVLAPSLAMLQGRNDSE